MRKLILALSFVFFLFGCTAVKQATVDAKSCLADPICRAEAVSQADNAKEVAVAVGGASPIPLSSNLVGGVVYGLVFIYALVKGGRKKREDTQPIPE